MTTHIPAPKVAGGGRSGGAAESRRPTPATVLLLVTLIGLALAFAVEVEARGGQTYTGCVVADAAPKGCE